MRHLSVTVGVAKRATSSKLTRWEPVRQCSRRRVRPPTLATHRSSTGVFHWKGSALRLGLGARPPGPVHRGPGEVDTAPSVLGSQVRGEVRTSPIRILQNNPSLAGGLVGMCPRATFPEFAHSIEVIAVDNDRADAYLTSSMIEMTRRSAKRVMVSERTGRAASKCK